MELLEIPWLCIAEICLFLQFDEITCLKLSTTLFAHFLNWCNHIPNQILKRIITENNVISAINEILNYAECLGKDYNLPTKVSQDIIAELFNEFEILRKLSIFAETKIFQTYCRLIPFNWQCFRQQQLPLINVFKQKQLFKCRHLNDLEEKIFVVKDIDYNYVSTTYSIVDFETFKTKLHSETHYHLWKTFIFDNNISDKIYFSGGSLLKCVATQWQLINGYSNMDLDFFIFAGEVEFRIAVDNIHKNFLLSRINAIMIKPDTEYPTVINMYANFVTKFNKLISTNTWNDFDQFVEFQNISFEEANNWIHFQFIFVQNVTEPASLLHSFDIDCVQMLFDGKNVFATYPCIQSLNTNAMIHYAMCTNKALLPTTTRAFKYMERGWRLLCNKEYFKHLYSNEGIDSKPTDQEKMFAEKFHNTRINLSNGFVFYAKSRNFDFFGVRLKLLNNI